MDQFFQYLVGPNVYATLRPKGPYEANLMEKLGGMLVYASEIGRAVGWAASPFLLYYLVFRFDWSTPNVLSWAHLLVTYHSVAYGLRAAGRLTNPVYRGFIQMYIQSWTSREIGEKLLESFDFEVSDCFGCLLKMREKYFEEKKLCKKCSLLCGLDFMRVQKIFLEVSFF